MDDTPFTTDYGQPDESKVWNTTIGRVVRSDHFLDKQSKRGVSEREVLNAVNRGDETQSYNDRTKYEHTHDGLTFVVIVAHHPLSPDVLVTAWVEVENYEVANSPESEWSTQYVNMVNRRQRLYSQNRGKHRPTADSGADIESVMDGFKGDPVKKSVLCNQAEHVYDELTDGTEQPLSKTDFVGLVADLKSGGIDDHRIMRQAVERLNLGRFTTTTTD